MVIISFKIKENPNKYFRKNNYKQDIMYKYSYAIQLCYYYTHAIFSKYEL